MAMTRSRQRLPSGPRMRSRPMRRRVPRTAATWPCGRGSDDEGLGGGRRRDDGCALEEGLEALEQVRGPVGEVAERALLDLATLAVGLAQQDGWWRAAVGNGLDVHGHAGCHAPAIMASGKRRFTCPQFEQPQTGVRAISTAYQLRK